MSYQCWQIPQGNSDSNSKNFYYFQDGLKRIPRHELHKAMATDRQEMIRLFGEDSAQTGKWMDYLRKFIFIDLKLRKSEVNIQCFVTAVNIIQFLVDRYHNFK